MYGLDMKSLSALVYKSIFVLSSVFIGDRGLLVGHLILERMPGPHHITMYLRLKRISFNKIPSITAPVSAN